MQQINLYQKMFQREDSWLHSSGLLKISGAFAAVLFLLYAQAAGSSWLQARKVSDLEARKAEQEQRLQELNKQARNPGEGKVLASEIDALTEEVRIRQRMYEVLSPGASGNTEGFSSHLVGLARQRVKGVWLRSIRIDEGGQQLVLVGSTLDPEGVPDLLEKLGHEEAFMGREFHRLLLERKSKESRTVNFTLSTQAGADS